MADSREGVQAVGKFMIEADVELVVISAVGNQVLIVVRASGVGRGKIVQYFAREVGHRNRRPSLVGIAGQRIAHIHSENTVALSQGGQRGKDQRLRDLTETFVIEKEESVVFNNGAAECKAELITNQRRFDAAHRFEKAHGVQGGVTVVFPQVAVKLIRAAAV